MGRGVDAGRTLGSSQNFSMQSHTHAGAADMAGAHTPSGSTAAAGGTAAVGVATNNDTHSHGMNSAGNHAHSLAGGQALKLGGGGSNALSNYNNIGHSTV